ncbi:MAG: hypothetical protein JSV11_02340 [Nitrospiraceae bacterium]|nr:MAG: hypothetical protein JSU99_06760 [Nitrospiraceae bacterium]UCH45563.1 MAG: hypothetical protein JSV11_02340 [Nitrospiraceae bacterium]
MRKCILLSIIVPLFSLPLWVSAAGFDGSEPLLCSLTRAFECYEDQGCAPLSVQDMNLPRFLKVNVPQKKVTGVKEGGRTTDILNVREIDGKLFLQGAEDAIENVRDGLGWTVAIMEDSGNMILTGSGDNVGFAVFGACIAE